MDTFILLQKSLQYGFMQKALICGVMVAITSSLLGVFLVLKKQSLIVDGLSHISFATVSFALLVGFSPIAVSIPLVIFASFFINKLTEKAFVYNDAAIGLVSAFSIALGVIIISMSKGFNVDIYSYLFGSILAITEFEVIISVSVSVVVIVVIILLFNELFLVAYDSDYANISKTNTKTINLIFSIIQSIIIVIGIKIIGAMLMSALTIFPVVSALQIANNFKKLVVLALIISVTSVVLGIFLSFFFNTPTGATIVIINGLVFFLFFVTKQARYRRRAK